MPRSRDIIFRNEHTRLTPLGPKLMFWCVSYYLGAFGTVWLPYKTWYKTSRSGAKVRAMKSWRNFLQWTTRSTLLDPNLMFGVFRTIWVHLVPFGCLIKLGAKRAEVVQKFVPWSRGRIFHNERTGSTHWTLTSCFGAFCTIWMHLGPFGCLTKRAELVQKFMPRSRVITFRNEHTRLTPLGPKLMFWCISYYLCAFGTVWLPYKTRCKTSRSGAKVRAMKSCQNFSQRTHPIHPIGPKTHVS